MKPLKSVSTLAAAAVLALTGCAQQTEQSTATPGLSDYYQGDFVLGTALNRAQIMVGADEEALTERVRADNRGYFYEKTLLTDPKGLDLGLNNFNALTPENVMKWEEIHPEPGVYDFEAADRFVELAEEQGAFITAHALVWHNQTPDWVYEDEDGNTLSREALLERMREHIHTVVGRYKGRIQSYDVVNEALDEEGGMRESRWYEIIGKDYLVKAFQYAREADPEAELYYNDYSMENPEKRAGAVRLVKYLQENDAPITGIGNQSHYRLGDFPELSEVEQTLVDFAELGIDVMVTELDINVLASARDEEGELKGGTDIYRDGLPEDVEQEQARRYRELFEIYHRHRDSLTRVTLWGHMDADSWLNYLPMERVNHPLIFDRNHEPKAAYDAIIEAVE